MERDAFEQRLQFQRDQLEHQRAIFEQERQLREEERKRLSELLNHEREMRQSHMSVSLNVIFSAAAFVSCFFLFGIGHLFRIHGLKMQLRSTRTHTRLLCLIASAFPLFKSCGQANCFLTFRNTHFSETLNFWRQLLPFLTR